MTNATDDLVTVMSNLYASEINCGVESFWDGGFTAFLGDGMNGRDEDRTFYPSDMPSLPDWLSKTACRLYPESDYAKARVTT